ncbi:MAG: DUF1015 domain-containing protein [Solirubrobacterales bacterium]|nr:DUF1015 domain-containing protein [Solirubrobacterales bacterium]MBV9714561.1 DUF1015 domain-containing protein [Solirubrobacterales bacterium]
MATIEPLRALHYDLGRVGRLQDVVAPPYDVIDAEERAALERRSPFNVVRLDLPAGPDPYASAAAQLADWRRTGAVVEDEEPAVWVLSQDYRGPDGRARSRHGFLARARVEDYGPGRIRPHERTHPGPKEDRLKLTRATRANLSPIFALYSDRDGSSREVLAAASDGEPWASTRDDDGTVNRIWRLADPVAIERLKDTLGSAELLIADGHHRYETARAYAAEVGGEGDHRYVLMCLVALEDPGLTIFPTHRLLRGLSPEQQEALATAIRRDFEIEALGTTAELAPAYGEEVTLGYIDSHFRRPFRLRLKDRAIADAALPDHAEAYRRLDTAVLEALILKAALGMTDEDIDHLCGLGYARSSEEALRLVQDGEFDAAFFMAPTPVERVQAVAAAGESMPPKSTYFFPKVPTGLVFNPLAEDDSTRR